MELLKSLTTGLIVRGVLAIILGIVALVWPMATLVALVLMWGIYAIADGVFALIGGFGPGLPGWQRIMVLAFAAISLMAGFFAIARPITGAVVLTWALGLWLVVRGAFDLVSAFQQTLPAPRWLVVTSGLLTLVAGLLVMANPGEATVALGWWLGFFALAWGVLMVAAGVAARGSLTSADRA